MDDLTRLLLDAQRGDTDALEHFIAETLPDVRTICRHLGDRDNADDLVQETYQRAVRSLHRYRATGPAKHWLLTIARRTCADAARRRTRRRRLTRRVSELSPGDAEVQASDAIGLEIDELLDQLDPDRRAAFVLTQLNGLSYDDAARLLDVPIGTIRSRVARAREQLISALADTDRRSGHDPAGEPRRRARRP